MSTEPRIAEFRAMLDPAYHKVSVPEGSCGEMKIDRFIETEHSPANLRLALHGRTPNPPGTYTRLTENGMVWMSDVVEEVEMHRAAFTMMWELHASNTRVLIHGLGLGMVLQAALRLDCVSHVDVVEIDPRVIALVGPHYEQMARDLGKSLNVVCADCYTYRWPVGSFWNAVWHDIWPSTSVDNLPEMTRLKRMFGHRCRYQGCWGERQCRDIRSGAYHRQHQRRMADFYQSLGLTREGKIA